MKNLKILVLCLFLILSSHGFSIAKEKQENKTLSLTTITYNRIPNIFRPVRWFKRLFGRRRAVCGLHNDPPNVSNVVLSRTEIIAGCSAKSGQKSYCSSDTQSIEISTKADDPEGDVITYIYQITGGKIVGTGANVTWDLSGVNPGTYTITVAGDSGSATSGKTITKEVRVVECADCP